MAIDIVPFSAEHARAFYALNRAWLDAHELYEPPDEAQLSDPEGTILAAGGRIFVAVERDASERAVSENGVAERDVADRDVVVGTVAVAPHGHGEMELLKLGVSDAARGQGLGRRLVDACIQHARSAGANRLVLISSTRLGPALRLYESMGFLHAPVPEDTPYQTADVFMQLPLTG